MMYTVRDGSSVLAESETYLYAAECAVSHAGELGRAVTLVRPDGEPEVIDIDRSECAKRAARAAESGQLDSARKWRALARSAARSARPV